MFKRPYDEFHPSELACGLTESSKKHTLLEPNPWRKKSGGRMVYAVPLIIFMDDVSGNISKQWNKHFVIYMSNANLPHEMLQREFFVRFVASSPHASPYGVDVCYETINIVCLVYLIQNPDSLIKLGRQVPQGSSLGTAEIRRK